MVAADIGQSPPLSEPSPRQLLLRRIVRHKGLVFGATVLIAILAAALLGPFLIEHEPFDQDLKSRLVPPFWYDRGDASHLLGTDHLGRDYLARLLYGAQISLFIGLSVAIISGVIGASLGILAGYMGGRVDTVVMFLITTRLAMPVILVALAVVALIGSSLQTVILVLGFLLWERYALVLRSSTMQARSMDYVEAAKAQGCSTFRILLGEIMPNIVNNLIVVATLEMAHAIILEAALSFLGLGVQPPLPSWGLMVAEGREFLLFDAWLITIPGVMLFLLVLAINLLGDGIRDVTAPEGR